MRCLTIPALVALILVPTWSHAGVIGTVVDAETGKTVKDYSVVRRPGEKPNRSMWQQHTVQRVHEGPFTIDGQRLWETTQIRVWAAGYRPSIVTVKKQLDATLEIRLTRDPSLRGKVLTPDGQPAAGASVALATTTTEPRVRGTSLTLGSYGEKIDIVPAVAGTDGTFMLPSDPDPALLVAVHESGWAEVNLAEIDKPVTLRPWARIEGRLLLGDKPAGAGWPVSITRSNTRADDGPQCGFWIEVEPDAEGNFVAEHVAPVSVHVTPVVRIGSNTCSVTGLGVWVEPRPGETVKLALGGVGRPVIGRLVSADGKAADWSSRKFRVGLHAPHFGHPGDDKMWQVQAEFIKAAGAQRYRHEVVPAADGRFRIDRLPQGQYNIYDIGARQPRIDVKPMEGGTSDQPLDLGDLQVHGPPNPAVK